jgi:hypothetical protein
MAPEALHGEAGFASDVFSFGVFLWEVATRKLPWEGENIAKIIYKVCFKNARLPIDDSMAGYLKLSELLSRCWLENADARPSFATVERMTIACYNGEDFEWDDVLSAPPPARKPEKAVVRAEPSNAAKEDDAACKVAVGTCEGPLLTPVKLDFKALASRIDVNGLPQTTNTVPDCPNKVEALDIHMHTAWDMKDPVKNVFPEWQAYAKDCSTQVSQAPPPRPVCVRAKPQHVPPSHTIGYATGYATGRKMSEHTLVSKQKQVTIADFEQNSSSIAGGPRRNFLQKAPSMTTLVASQTLGPRLVPAPAATANFASAPPRRSASHVIPVFTSPSPKIFGVPRLAQTGTIA